MIGALDRSVERPLLVYLIRGFRCFRAITADSTLGRVSMIGRTDISNFNEITGQLALEKDISRSYKQWRKDAQNMLDHVLLVMSFASGTYLRVPIHRLYERRKVTIDFYDVSVVVKPTWPAIHYLDLSGILQTAADNFGGLPVRVAKFPYAVEWILLPTTYNEIRLISRMTALENLAHHNLNARESRYMGRSSFDRLAAQIRGVIRAANLPPDAGDSMAASVGELNRKSLEAKILELMERWEVPMGDLPKNTVADIIKARNHVVHRGVYSHESSDQDLWHHVVLLNEIVTRLVLALLRFRGMYECYVGGHHRRRFPECERV